MSSVGKMTPGPWTIDPEGEVALMIEGQGEHIATVEGVGPEAQANARAIAALPDLVEAASRVLDRCHDNAGDWMPSDYENAWDSLRAALAKLDGEGGEA